MPITITQHTPGKYSMHFNCGENAVDPVIEQLGHNPNGYFWEGIAQFLVATELPGLDGRFDYDPEAGMFSAFGSDQASLEQLGERMGKLLDDEVELSRVVEAAHAAGVQFDD